MPPKTPFVCVGKVMACIRCQFKKHLEAAPDRAEELARASEEVDWPVSEIECWLKKKGCAPPDSLRQRISAYIERHKPS